MLKTLIMEYKWRLIAASIFNGASAAGAVSIIALLSGEINESGSGSLTERALIFMAAVVFMFVLGVLAQYLLSVLGTSLVCRIRTLMVSRILATGYEEKERLGGHRIHATITSDISSISQSLGFVPIMAFNITSILFCCIYLFYLSWLHAIVFLACLSTCLVVSKFLIVIGHRHAITLREKEDDLFKAFKALVDGVKELSVGTRRREHFYHQQAIPVANEIRHLDSHARIFWNLWLNWLSTSIFISIALLVFVAHLYMPLGDAILSGFILVAVYIRQPLSVTMNFSQDLSRGWAAYKKIASLNLSAPKLGELCESHNELVRGPDNWRQLTANGICYTYKDEHEDFHFSIGPIDLTINRGELVFICGGNGSGKSTFAKLLVGLYKPSDGAFFLDKMKIDNNSLQWYQDQISVIYSDFYLFEYPLNSQGEVVNFDTVQPHLEKLQLEKKVGIINGKLSTTDLSHGQKKRLALLLAYLEDSPIYIFDEWAADQDPVFRKYFYTQLLPELKTAGKTVIVITHDDKYFYIPDKLYQFDNGQVQALAIPMKASVA